MNHVERFVDAGYWIALVNQRDALHDRAMTLARTLGGPLVTTDLIVVELADGLAGRATRETVTRFIREIESLPNIEVLPLTRELLSRGFELYAARRDKEWGLTDCTSFVVMEDRGIYEALAYDQHFVQAGYRALLREQG